MTRVFTKLGRKITIVVKADGPDPNTNPRLCVLVQTAEEGNIPKENMERAIKKATDKDSNIGYKEMNHEGHSPYGMAIFVETARDNTTHTVANVRNYFNKLGGSLGTTGSLEFLFDHRRVFHAQPKAEVDQKELIPDLTDYGMEGIKQGEEEWAIKEDFSQNGAPQARLEELGFETSSVEFIYVPKDTRSASAEEREKFSKLIERPEEDENVQSILTNMEDEEE